MGAYSPAPIVTPQLHARVMREIIQPTVRGMERKASAITGFLYAGLMIDAQGNPKTLEFNCRMGDPETQPIMARLKGDFSKVVELAIAGTLDTARCSNGTGARRSASCSPRTTIRTRRARATASAIFPPKPRFAVTFHAGTTLADGKLTTSGGRVLCVVGSVGFGSQRAIRGLRYSQPDFLRRHAVSPRHRLSSGEPQAERSPRLTRSDGSGNTRAAGPSRPAARFLRGRFRKAPESASAQCSNHDRHDSRRTSCPHLPHRPANAYRRDARRVRRRPFATDAWQRGPGERLRGGGCTRILEGGNFFERGGIGFSDVSGDALPPSASAARPQLAGRGFEAMGVSLVMHPQTRTARRCI